MGVRVDEEKFECDVFALYFCTASIITGFIFQSVVKYEILRHCYLLVFYICFCFLGICCLATLSTTCVIRRKDKAKNKPLWKLRDSDLESEDENEDHVKESKWLRRIAKSFIRFMDYKRIYGLVFKVGVFFVVVALFLKGASFYYPSMKEDFRYPSSVLAIVGIALISLVITVYKFPKPKPVMRTYKPFQDSISVPMTAFIPKLVLHLTRNLLYILGIVFYQSAAFYGLLTLRLMPEQEMEGFKQATNFKDIRVIMVIILAVCNMCGIVLFLENLKTAINMAKEDILLTFEKNWKRNLVALDHFLPEKDFESLEELRDAYLEKSQREDLTMAEQKIIKYIETPLWKSKRNFLHRRQDGNGIPKELLSDWPLEPPVETPIVETTPPSSEVGDEASSSSPIPSPRMTRSRAKLQ